MGYNLSNNAYKQVKPILDELVDLEIGSIWKQSFQDNHKAARMIRQGFEYCIKNDVGERYAKLKQNIRIRVTNEYVLAERKFAALQPLISKEIVREKTFSRLYTTNEVLTTFLANRQLTKLVFPDYNEFDSMLGKVTESYNYYIFVPGPRQGIWIIKNAESRDEKEHSN